ncbi:hypothetical protein QUA30_12460 [Microcoleus sp. Pol14C2]|uniref:hypothetical protein n=1 Tax=unclassified Microcoleus TaxID=2642155 RepID=UPI002FD366D0
MPGADALRWATILVAKGFLQSQATKLVIGSENQGDCTIAITPCYGEGDITQPWQDAATVTLATQDCLNGESSAE